MDADILDGSWVNFSRFTWALSGARNRRAQWHCSTRFKYVQHHILLAGPNRPTIGDTQEENVPYPPGHREGTRRRIVRRLCGLLINGMGSLAAWQSVSVMIAT